MSTPVPSAQFNAPTSHYIEDDIDFDDDFDDDEVEDERPSRGPRLSPHFFRREKDGSVKLRIKLTPEEAAMIEEAAGETPLMLYIHRVLADRAKFHISRNNRTVSKSG
jgi:hypothetical protein